MNNNGTVLLAILIAASVLIIFCLGCLVGDNSNNKEITQKLCEIITKTPSDYINCSTKDINTVIKMIRKEDKLNVTF